MALDILKKFESGNTAYFECYYRDMQGNLKDPDNPKYRIFNMKNSEVVSSTTPSKKITGLYYFFWTPEIPGNYIIEFTGSILGLPIQMRKKFQVIKTSLKGEI